MKTSIFRHGKAALASAVALGLIVASSPLAQSTEETTTQQTAQATTATQTAEPSTATQTAEPSTATQTAEPSTATQTAEPSTAVDDSTADVEVSEGADGTAISAVNPAPKTPVATPVVTAEAGERSAAVGPKADFKLETVEVADGVATVKVSGTIVDETGLNKPMESLMLHKRGNKAQVSEVVSATYDGEEAFGDVFDFQPKELKDTFGVSDEDAQFPQVLRISLEPTQDGDAKASLVGKKFSATYQVPAEDKDTQWVLLATDAAFLPEPVFEGPKPSALSVAQVPAKFYRENNNTPAEAPDPNGYNFPSNPQKYKTRFHDKAYEIIDGDMKGPDPYLPNLPVKEKAAGFAPYPGYFKDAGRKTLVNHYGWCGFEYGRDLSYDDALQQGRDTAWGARYGATLSFGPHRQNAARCAFNHPGEQGRFFSQEHISRVERNNRNDVRRSEEFTIGGNDGGVWYGGYFGVTAKGGYTVSDSHKPGEVMRIQLGDLLDTDGWVVTSSRFAANTPSYVLTPVPVNDPSLEFGVLITPGQGDNGTGIRFLSAEGIRGYSNGDSSVLNNLETSYRGINLDPNTPIKISFKTKEGNATSGSKASSFEQGYFKPIWGPFDAPSDLTVKKENLTDNGSDEFTYDIVVSNTGDGSSRKPVEREFEVFDTPTFVQGVQITRRVLVDANGVERDFGQLESGKGYPVPNEGGSFTHSIGANETKTYRVKILVDSDSIPGSSSSLQCSTPLSPGEGAYNKARIEYGNDKVAEDDACINIEKPQPPLPPRVTKTVFYKNYEDPRIQNPGSYRVGYTITISNKPEGGNNQPGRYIKRELVVKDFLGLPEDDVTITEITGGDRYGSKDKLTRDSDGSVTLTYGTKPGKVILNPGEEIEYQMFVNFTKPAVSAPEENLACGQPFSKGHGAYNKVVIEKEGAGTENALTSEICANIPVTPKPTITKEVEENSGTEVTETPEGKLSVQYKVHVENPAAGGNLTDLVIKDRPQFAEDAKNVQYFVKEGENSSYPTTASSLDNGQLIFATVSLTPGQSKTYFVKAVFDKPAYAEQVRATLTCDPQQGAGHGLFNEASLSLGEKELAKDSDCANIPEPEKPVTGLILQKEDTDNNPIPLDKDWQFEIYKADDQWNPQGKAIEFVTEDRAKNQRSTAADALTVGKYVLVETKAPQGYQLLAQPVRLEVYLDGAEIKVKQPDGVNNAAAQVENPNIVKVADVTTGDMPKSGGMGVFWLLLAGLALLGAAWWFNRKRS